jgi:hypothetical protein
VFVLMTVSFPSCFLSSLSLENLQQILSPQAFRKGKSLVAQGDVAGHKRKFGSQWMPNGKSQRFCSF